MVKRTLGMLLALALLLAPGAAFAQYDYTKIQTPTVLLVDGNDTNTVFYEKQADTKAFPASTTKIMTCILALEHGNLDDRITVGEEVRGTKIKFTSRSSLMIPETGLQPGETLTLRDLLHGLMLVSGNDAAEAIAVHLAGSVDAFVAMMNQKAASLGMTHTHYVNPHGVHDDNHYTTARDMAKLTAYALQNEAFRAIVTTATYTVPASNLRTTELVLANTNKLIRKPDADTDSFVYPYALGVKTGDTTKAGKCLVAAAEKDGARLILILFGDAADLYGNDPATTQNARFQNAVSVFEETFSSMYETLTAAELNLQKDFSVQVANAAPEALPGGTLPLAVDTGALSLRALPAVIAGYKNAAASVQANVTLAENLTAPLTRGTSVGRVDYVLNGETLFTAELLAPMDVPVSVSVSTQTAAPNASATPGGDALVTRPQREPLSFWVWLLLILIALLIAMIVVYIVSEQKRKKRRRNRRRRQTMRESRE